MVSERPDIDRLAETLGTALSCSHPITSDERDACSASNAALDELVALARTLRDCETQERQLRTAVRECCESLEAAEQDAQNARLARTVGIGTMKQRAQAAEARVAELEAALRRIDEDSRKVGSTTGHFGYIARAALAGDGGGA